MKIFMTDASPLRVIKKRVRLERLPERAPDSSKNMYKAVIKRIFFAIALTLTSPLVILSIAESSLFGRRQEKIMGWCKEILSLCPTIVGENLRLSYYWAVCKDISLDAVLMFGSMIAHRDTVIGPGTVVGTYAIVGYSEIGGNVLIGARVSLISGKYQHGRPRDRAAGEIMLEQYDTIHIGDNAWIGQDSIIMADIGENCTIGAGSVVYKKVPPNCTFMGNPARRVNVDQLSSVGAI